MSDYSIDYILNRAGEKYIGTNASLGILERIKLNLIHRRSLSNEQHPYHMPVATSLLKSESDGEQSQMEKLERLHMYDWLQYTRYHPPKLPRPIRQGPAKRTPGRLPRIPFTPDQLQTLEEAYRNSNYLSAEDANKLANSLDLTSTRVKIWFQNRRARKRREKRIKHESNESMTLSSNTSSPEPFDDGTVFVG